jgi:hypothetical protein
VVALRYNNVRKEYTAYILRVQEDSGSSSETLVPANLHDVKIQKTPSKLIKLKYITAYPSEVIFKFVCSTSCGTDSCDKRGQAFRLSQFQEVPHFTSWKADEMKGPFPASNHNVVHLKQNHDVNVSDTQDNFALRKLHVVYRSRLNQQLTSSML